MAGPRQKEQYASAVQCGAKITEVRKTRGLTLKQVAVKTGFSPQQIFLVEKGKINTPIETLARIAEALDVPLVELVGALNGELSDEQMALAIQLRTFRQFYEQCPKEVWAHISGMFAHLAACQDACQDPTSASQSQQACSYRKYDASYQNDPTFDALACYA